MITESKTLRNALYAIFILYSSFSMAAENPRGPYLGQEPPGLVPVIFAQNIISVRGRFEDGVSFSPDGLECCVAVTNSGWTTCNLYYSQKADGQWSTPRLAYFQGGGDGWTCQFGPDGLGFYFISTRSGYQPDVWMCRRSGMDQRWSNPSRVSSPVSLSNEREWAPAVTLDGTIYFTSPRGGGYGANDIWRSRLTNGRYETAENIGPPVNTSAGEQSAFIAPDESYIIFTCGGRPDTLGSTDLYISYHFEDDSWAEPVNLGALINSEHEERCPYVSFDGKYLFFTRRSDTDADVYWVKTPAFIPDPNGPVENRLTGERYGSIQAAIAYADNGDEIVLTPGTYQERFDTMNKNLIIRSSESYFLTVENTVIFNETDEPAVILNDGSSLQGLTITGGGIGVLAEGISPSISYCRIEQGPGDGIQVAGGTHMEINNCIITDNNGAGIRLLSTPGRNKTYGNCTVTNCTIAKNSGLGIAGEGPNSIITNSIIYFNCSRCNRTQVDDSSITISYSDIQGGWETGSIGNTDIDPLFTDAENGDYHLQSSSPCIDAGNPESDYELEPEPNGARINMGAYGDTNEAVKSN